MEGFILGPNLLGRVRETVDRVEAVPIAGGPLRIQTRFEDGITPAPDGAVRIATYTGDWPKGTNKTVTPLVGDTTTISVLNHFVTLAHGTCTSTQWKCAIAQEGTAWNLIQWEFATATAIFLKSVATTQVLTDITLAFNTANCAITKTNTTALVVGVGTTVTSTYVYIPQC